MMTEDFTKLPPGSLVSMSRTIILCPLCGRFGALEQGEIDLRRCIHIEESIIHTDGMRVEPRDYCELATFVPAVEEPLEDPARASL